MTDSIELDQLVTRPPAAVWRALTEPELLAAWWVPNDIAPVVGHRFHLDMGQWGKQPCEVLEVEPLGRLSWEFRVTVAGQELTTLSLTRFRDRGAFQLDGVAHTVAAEGFLQRTYRLERGGLPVARAEAQLEGTLRRSALRASNGAFARILAAMSAAAAQQSATLRTLA